MSIEAAQQEMPSNLTGIVQTVQRRVFYAPTARRHYFSKQAAIHGEAIAIIKRRHPSEHESPEPESGYPGHDWTWRMLPRSHVLLRRVKLLVRVASAAAAVQPVGAAQAGVGE